MTATTLAIHANATSLETLLTELRAAQARGDAVDYSSLPTFGGTTPADTRGTWSWDATRLLTGSCVRDMRIVPRAARD